MYRCIIKSPSRRSNMIPYECSLGSRSAFPITETALNVIAALRSVMAYLRRFSMRVTRPSSDSKRPPCPVSSVSTRVARLFVFASTQS